MRSEKLAILFFSRTASLEASQKTFIDDAGWKGNRAVAQRLIQRAERIGRSSPYSFFSFFENDQRGRNFGERLANAIEDVYKKGFDRVVIIGNDCPSLTTDLLQESADELLKGKLVFGPAKDGGLYLFGLSNSTYNRKDFLSLPWESSKLAVSFENYAKAKGIPSHTLSVLTDIDNSIDFRLFFRSLLPGSGLREALASIIASIFHPHLRVEIFPFLLASRLYISLRAP